MSSTSALLNDNAKTQKAKIFGYGINQDAHKEDQSGSTGPNAAGGRPSQKPQFGAGSILALGGISDTDSEHSDSDNEQETRTQTSKPPPPPPQQKQQQKKQAPGPPPTPQQPKKPQSKPSAPAMSKRPSTTSTPESTAGSETHAAAPTSPPAANVSTRTRAPSSSLSNTAGSQQLSHDQADDTPSQGTSTGHMFHQDENTKRMSNAQARTSSRQSYDSNISSGDASKRKLGPPRSSKPHVGPPPHQPTTAPAPPANNSSKKPIRPPPLSTAQQDSVNSTDESCSVQDEQSLPVDHPPHRPPPDPPGKSIRNDTQRHSSFVGSDSATPDDAKSHTVAKSDGTRNAEPFRSRKHTYGEDDAVVASSGLQRSRSQDDGGISRTAMEEAETESVDELATTSASNGMVSSSLPDSSNNDERIRYDKLYGESSQNTFAAAGSDISAIEGVPKPTPPRKSQATDTVDAYKDVLESQGLYHSCFSKHSQEVYTDLDQQAAHVIPVASKKGSRVRVNEANESTYKSRPVTNASTSTLNTDFVPEVDNVDSSPSLAEVRHHQRGTRRRNHFPVVRVSSRLKHSLSASESKPEQRQHATKPSRQYYETRPTTHLNESSNETNRKWKPIYNRLTQLSRRTSRDDGNTRKVCSPSSLSIYDRPSQESPRKTDGNRSPNQHSASVGSTPLRTPDTSSVASRYGFEESNVTYDEKWKSDTLENSIDNEVQRILDRRRRRHSRRDTFSPSSSMGPIPSYKTPQTHENSLVNRQSNGVADVEHLGEPNGNSRGMDEDDYSSIADSSTSTSVKGQSAASLKKQLGEWNAMSPQSRIYTMASRLQSRSAASGTNQQHSIIALSENTEDSLMSHAMYPHVSRENSYSLKLFNLPVQGENVESLLSDATHPLDGGATMLKRLFQDVPLRIDSVYERPDNTLNGRNKDELQMKDIPVPLYVRFMGILSSRPLGETSRLQLLLRGDPETSSFFPIGEPKRSLSLGTECSQDLHYTVVHVIDCGMGPSKCLKASPKTYPSPHSEHAYSFFIHMVAQEKTTGILDDRVECILDLRAPSKATAEHLIGSLLLMESITPAETDHAEDAENDLNQY
eukprot:gb/GECG01002030.1/.p1 GENE.gb/GECG01002030.1/~~gb/GECG01002030.1/.p1  ORF type:complete len:1088 (+),score=150.13 gb/GECG01002030.1/:1-3264(+)